MRKPKLDLPETYRLDLHPCGGATLDAAANDAFVLQRATGVRVDVIHNDRRYRVELSITEDGPAPQAPAKVA